MISTRLSLSELERLAVQVLVASRTAPDNARPVAGMLAAAEADDLHSHGLSRLPFYADQAVSGKIDGYAVPAVRQLTPAAVYVDARAGFAVPAIEAGVERALALAAGNGVATIGVGNSHHFGVAGYHVERIAERGFVALACGNTPAAIAPCGGTVPLFGTNPLAFACPRRQGPPLVIDLSLSQAARGKIVAARQRGATIPAGWALDAAGEPTTDPAAALAGSLLPIAGAKGAALALMVEVLTAALTGSNFGYEATSFFDAEGPPPRVGQFFLILNPALVCDGGFCERVDQLLAAVLAQPGARLPGDRRLAARASARAHGVAIPTALYDELAARIVRAGEPPLSVHEGAIRRGEDLCT